MKTARTTWLLLRLALLTLGQVADDLRAQPLPLVKVRDNQRFLVTGDNRPFFRLADTAWQLIHGLNEAEVRLCFADCRDKGLAVIQTVALDELRFDKPNACGRFRIEPKRPDRPITKDGPNNDSWDDVERVLRLASEDNLRVALLPTWGKWVISHWQSELGNGFFTSANAETYGRFIGARFKDHAKTIWIPGADKAAPTDEARAIWRAMARGRALTISALSAVEAHPSGLPAEPVHLHYAPAPPDNPLKGFVSYPRERASFPRSLEWDYTKLSDVMTGPTNFNWAPFDRKLDAAAARGCQFIARFYLEWPGKTTGVPKFLLEAGLPLRTWTNTNTQPGPPAVDHTPDYEDPRLRAALTNFIHALGARYDGDPRLGFVGLGLLGTWGEWHNHPNTHWFASKTVQREVMDAYQLAFRRTKLVARYPAGPDHPRYADNSTRPLGYHDDSFAWATVHTDRKQDDWFFEPLLRRAGALEKWRTQPIGGEVRPEVWDCLFDDRSCAPRGQEIDRCVEVTHVSWLCNEGVFSPRLQGAARERAVRAARRMGYELHLRRADLVRQDGGWTINLSVTNTGVAPFYYDWPVELGALDAAGKLAATWKTAWKLTGILPGEPARLWQHRLTAETWSSAGVRLLVRVPNPMPGGRPLRFANQEQDRDLEGWLTLGTIGP
jgi:hypothetical protein